MLLPRVVEAYLGVRFWRMQGILAGLRGWFYRRHVIRADFQGDSTILLLRVNLVLISIYIYIYKIIKCN